MTSTNRHLTALLVPVALLSTAGVALMLSVATQVGADVIPGLPDPGALTAQGLPVVRAIRNVASAVVVGALAFVVWVLPCSGDNYLTKLQLRLTRLAGAVGCAWLFASLGELVLTYSDVSGQPATTLSWAQLQFYVSDIELGRTQAWGAVLAMTAAFASATARTVTGVLLSAGCAVASIWAMSLTGHAAGSANHDLAVNAAFLHVMGMGLWLGGLLTLVVLVRWVGGAERQVFVARYSRVAGWSFLAVMASGIAASLLRVSSLASLRSEYGALLLLKAVALCALGLLGLWQRRSVLSRLGTDRGDWLFTRLALTELLVMATAAGAGSVLSRTPTPGVTTEPTGRIEAILGRSLPPPLGAGEWFSQWRFDSFWGPMAVMMVVAYVMGAARLKRRGDTWSTLRTAAWTAGCAALFWATNGAPNAYGDVLFSMHMVQHMTIATTAPILLVIGAPVTLALRTLRPRVDGSRGPREWLLRGVHSWPARLLAHPVIATGIFIVGMVVFYYSSIFENSLRSHTMHLLMTAHFLVAGYLFANVICGVDPGPRRPAYPFRIVTLMVGFAFHALFSVSLMGSTRLLAPDWFTSVAPPWGDGPLEDQSLGAAIGWGLGEYPLAILAVALIWSWVHDDRRTARRLDRQAGRDGDRTLREYNEMLARLAGDDDTTR